MVTAVIYYKNLNRKIIANHCLQLLQVHLNAAVSGNQHNILGMICHTGAYGRRKTVAHGRDTGIGDKPLALFHDVSVTADHIGRAIAHYHDLVFI